MTETRKKFTFQLQDPQQQVEIMKQKGLTFLGGDESLAIQFLTHTSYLRLVGYFGPYRSKGNDGQYQFNDGVSFQTLYQSYQFDEKCRQLLFEYIGVIENSFKNSFSYQSITATSDNLRRTKSQYYKPITKGYTEIVTNIMLEITNQTSKSEYIQMYTKRYYDPPYPPFWNMIEVFTFGQVIAIFNSLQDKTIKIQIAQNYGFNDQVFGGVIKGLLDLRNACCHHSRLLYNNKINFPQTKHLQTVYDGHYSDLYAMCVTTWAMLKNIGTSDEFKGKLESLVNLYPEINNGFPKNWKNLWIN